MIEILRGDITTLDVDVIVNAANAALLPGAGVCGAIYRAAGQRLIDATRKIAICATGDAVLTPGFDAKARFIIHAVGPMWSGGNDGEATRRRSLSIEGSCQPDRTACRSHGAGGQDRFKVYTARALQDDFRESRECSGLRVTLQGAARSPR